jgi:hypothetical protein
MSKRIYCQDCPVREVCEAKAEAYRNKKLEVDEPKECPLWRIVRRDDFELVSGKVADVVRGQPGN